MTTESPSAAKNRKRFSAESTATGLKAGGEDFPFDGVFIFRETAALSTLLPGLEMDGAFIRVDRRMKTNLPGVVQPRATAPSAFAGRQSRRRGLRSRHFRRNNLIFPFLPMIFGIFVVKSWEFCFFPCPQQSVRVIINL